MELKQLYREIVNEHNLRPVHKGKLENPDLVMRGINPSCGDDITLQLKVENGVITDGKYIGSGSLQILSVTYRFSIKLR